VSRRSKKDETWGAKGSSTWKLKWPVKMNSVMKVAFEDDGGR
jgi:hypothetical protein